MKKENKICCNFILDTQVDYWNIKTFAILSCLNVLHNYFGGPTVIFRSVSDLIFTYFSKTVVSVFKICLSRRMRNTVMLTAKYMTSYSYYIIFRIPTSRRVILDAEVFSSRHISTRIVWVPTWPSLDSNNKIIYYYMLYIFYIYIYIFLT